MTATVFDDAPCVLGEGPLWHPKRAQLFWFDIISKQLRTREGEETRVWDFDGHVSAAGWVDHDTLLVASETGLFTLDLVTAEQTHIAPLEADNAVTRSNDGRADPFGGFWIGTMGKEAESGAGAIYRFYQGKVTKLYADITISNAICFAPGGDFAYFTDTPTQQIMRQALDQEGWPKGAPEVFIDLRAQGLNPDGAVVDAEGCLWNAQWGASRVARYAPDGQFLSAVEFPASQISCPAFGGDDLTTLFATSAAEGFVDPAPEEGQTFAQITGFKGQREHRVIL